MQRTLFAIFCALIAPALAASSLRVEGTELVVTDANGQVSRGVALDGAELDIGPLGTLRIETARLDASARFPDAIWLLQAKLRAPSTSVFENFCTQGPDGDTRMVMFQGYFDQQLQYVADPERFSISCTSGVEAKCLRWGYLPWRRSPDGSVALAPYYQACIRMARADYCGNDQPTTRNGTAIDVYDEIGIQQRTPDLPAFRFEAGWSPSGAVCVHHARIPEQLRLQQLPERCPRLQASELGPGCDEAGAKAAGALLYNRSIQRDG